MTYFAIIVGYNINLEKGKEGDKMRKNNRKTARKCRKKHAKVLHFKNNSIIDVTSVYPVSVTGVSTYGMKFWTIKLTCFNPSVSKMSIVLSCYDCE